MSRPADFKAQAQAVRQATQAKLRALRAERLEKMRAAKPQVAAPARPTVRTSEPPALEISADASRIVDMDRTGAVRDSPPATPVPEPAEGIAQHPQPAPELDSHPASRPEAGGAWAPHTQSPETATPVAAGDDPPAAEADAVTVPQVAGPPPADTSGQETHGLTDEPSNPALGIVDPSARSVAAETSNDNTQSTPGDAPSAQPADDASSAAPDRWDVLDMPTTPSEASPPPKAPRTPEEAPARSDLASLPGAGPGLVWVLQQQGIASLRDLADADGEKLRAALGVIGQILDVPGWIAHAQSQTPAEEL